MNDIIEPESYTPVNKLEKQGVRAVAGIAGGLALLIVGAVGARFPIVGIALGAITAFLGFGALFSKDPADKYPGMILSAAGIMLIFSRVGIPFIRPLAATLFNIGAIGLLAMGIVNGIKFLKGLKNRS